MTNPVCETKEAFEAHIRDMLRPDIGDEVNDYTELDYVNALSEDGWVDNEHWLAIWAECYETGRELTPDEREKALAYYAAGEDTPAPEFRIVPF